MFPIQFERGIGGEYGDASVIRKDSKPALTLQCCFRTLGDNGLKADRGTFGGDQV